MASYSNVIRKWHLTRRKESRDPFSIYSTTIITGLPAKQQRNTLGLQMYYGVFIFPTVRHRLVTLPKYVTHFQNPHLYYKHNSLCYSLRVVFFFFNGSKLAECTSFAVVYSPLKKDQIRANYFQITIPAVPPIRNCSNCLKSTLNIYLCLTITVWNISKARKKKS